MDAVEAALKGQALVPAGEAAVRIAGSLPHGHVAAEARSRHVTVTVPPPVARILEFLYEHWQSPS